MVNGTLRKAQALATYDFIYYPRIGEHDLKAGWYEHMEAMQGRRGTYHAGGLFTFWVRRLLLLLHVSLHSLVIFPGRRARIPKRL